MSLRLLVISLALSVLAACSSEQEHGDQQPLVTTDSRYTPEPYIKLEHPEWSRKAAMYQINTRQFTPERIQGSAGTVTALTGHGHRYFMAHAHPPDW